MMDDKIKLLDNTNDDHAQGNGSSSSIMSDEKNHHLLAGSLSSSLSNDDIDKCIYVTNINWRRRFSVSLCVFKNKVRKIR